MRRTCVHDLLLAFACVAGMASAVAADEREQRFEAKIRPVLHDVCFACHGGDRTSAALRVDSLEGLMQGGDSGPAITAGDPEASLLIQAIQRHPDVSAMPPDEAQALRPDQVADFVAWIRDGAVWPAQTEQFESAKHWAFEPIRDVTSPEVSDPTWSRSTIDRFIRTKQEAAGVAPAPPADRLTLIRRATFDLTGLPPTPDEVAAFLRDDAADAYERLIKRLLDSPAYGERWGRHWLDVVRYADTAGETADYPVPTAWRYRNYVIDAFNADKPYDEFLREQIAGDILASAGPPEKYAERVTATGYLAISRRFGFDSENYHHLTIQDTIDTLGQSVLGLSLGCARCHDHKFDPVSMRDYYALYGIFDSSRYAFPGSEQKQKIRSLVPLVPPTESMPQWRDFQQRTATLSAELSQQGRSVTNAVLRSLDDIDGDFELQAPAAGGSNGVLVPPWLYQGKISVVTEAQSPFTNVYPGGRVGVAIAADAGAYRIAQAIRPQLWRDASETVYVNLDFRIHGPAEPTTGMHQFSLGGLNGERALDVLINERQVLLRTGATDEILGTSATDAWRNLQLKVDLRRRVVSGRMSALGEVMEFAERPLNPDWSGTFELVVFDTTGEPDALRPAIEYDNLAVQPTEYSTAKVDAPADEEASLGSQNTATQEQSTEPASTADTQAQELETLLTEGPVPLAYAMVEGTPHDARIQFRGEPDQLGEAVPRGFIHVLGHAELPADVHGSGRLELAQWLTSPDHPLTSRVMVNRVWRYHFGRGLVKTPNDFGKRGLPPTHPELLDHLAQEFVRSGWSIKALHRRIMLSATYQQSAVDRADADDLYVGFQRRRLSAEEIRDSILAVSGELDSTPAHGHPFPSPTSWGFTQHAPFSAVYPHQQRSVYLMTQRLKRHPFLALFDGPDPNASTPQRMETTVPTQALFFLNDPLVHTAADAWAIRLQTACAAESERIDLAWRQAFGRSPNDTELSEAIEFLKLYCDELSATVGEDSASRALAAYLRTLLGSNEFLHVD